MTRGRGRSAVALVPLLGLAAAWLVLHAARPRIWAQVPGGRALGMIVVATLALGVLATTLVLGRRLLGDRLRYRRWAIAGFLALTGVLLVAQSFVSEGPTGSAWFDAETTSAYGPLAIWPALWMAFPKVGLYAILPLGRVLVLVATTAALATAGTVAWVRHRAEHAGAGTQGSLSAGTVCALATSSCPACAPPLASGFVAVFGAGSLGPWLAPLTTPGSLVSEVLAAAAPLMALGAVMVAAGPSEGGDDGSGRGVWVMAGGATLAGLILAVPVAAVSVLPTTASPQARDVAGLYDIVNLAGLAVLFAFELVLVGLVLWNRDNDEAEPNRSTERTRVLWLTAWIAVPVAILVVVAVPAVSVLYEHGQPTETDETYEVEVQAQNWAWVFTHPNGNKTLNQLTVPEGANVHLIVESEDVVHSVFVPDVGVKVDAVPARVNEQTFVADTPGTYRGACAEFCGIGHPEMNFQVVVVPSNQTADR